MIRLLLLALGIATAFGCGGDKEPKPEAPAVPTVVTPVPQLTTRHAVQPPRLVDAGTLQTLLTKASPRIRVFNFWATWCGPCMAELPMLRSFQVSHPDIDLVMVNVDRKELHNSKVRPAIAENAMQSLQHIFLDTTTPNEFLISSVSAWPSAIPVTMVVDKQGHEVARFVESTTTQQLEEALLRAGHI